ncbi:hypothetical protein PILCRDRAFT_340184 [Piloderma croceum F 1598]|uniref:Uncharacterized protein n=1 Tax=Piloderma croceum (strain F 1598) TaxID=765440 RepID=A0A0C3FP65_PILCF|nr:hypothetical protein PILCRDRAFT_340184 [Piloderma croceum F 1598]
MLSGRLFFRSVILSSIPVHSRTEARATCFQMPRVRKLRPDPHRQPNWLHRLFRDIEWHVILRPPDNSATKYHRSHVFPILVRLLFSTRLLPH